MTKKATTTTPDPELSTPLGTEPASPTQGNEGQPADDAARPSKVAEQHTTTNPPGRREGVVSDPDAHPEKR